jgi:hypothetical protein
MKTAGSTALLVLVLSAPARQATAGCNTIPEVPPSFHGVRGRVDRPFVRAGERDVITIDVPRPAERSPITAVSDVDITLVIKSIGAESPRAVFIPGDGKCEPLGETPCCLERLFCGGEPDCVDPGPGGADVQLLQTPDGARVSFRFPDSERVGPLTVVVTATRQRAPGELIGATCRAALIDETPLRPDLLACIDEFVSIMPGGGGPPPTPGVSGQGATLEIAHLMALSGVNDFQMVCDDDAGDLPHCKGTSKYVEMTLESNGDLLIPMKWTNILRPKGGPYETRQVRCSSAVEPFAGGGGRIMIPSAAFLQSGTLLWTTFASPPAFEPQPMPDRPNELTLFGTTDKDDSVLRIARRKLWRTACNDPAAQACEPASAGVDCGTASCVTVTPQYYACDAGSRVGLPCTRPLHCPGGQCKPGSTCFTIATGVSTGTACTVDSQCKAGEECGRGLFEFRDRAVNGAIEVPRTVSTGFAGVCNAGKDEGNLCASSASCNPMLFGSARCVGYRAEAILFVP